MVRHKNRYFVIHIRDEKTSDLAKLTFKAAALYNAIMTRVKELHGDFGVAAIRAAFTSKYCNDNTKIAVIRCRHGPHQLVQSVIPLINTVEKKRVALEIIYTGATIRQCYKFIKRYQQEKYIAACASLKTDEEKLALKKLLDCSDKVLEIT